MTSDRKQFNFRLSAEGEERLHRLIGRLRERRGPDVSWADVMQEALIQLESYLDWLDEAEKHRKRKT